MATNRPRANRPPTDRLRRPSHVAASLLVFLLLGGGGVLAANATAADRSHDATDPSTAPPVPDPLEVAMPRQGDRGVYELTKVPREEGTPDAFGGIDWGNARPISFAWGADRQMHNATGARHWTNHLETTRPYDAPDGLRWDNRTYLLYAGTTRTLAYETLRNESEVQQASPGAVPLLQASATRNDLDMVFVQYTDWESSLEPCGLRMSIQGTDVPLDRPTTALLGCGMFQSYGERTSVLEPVGIAESDGVREARFRILRDGHLGGFMQVREGIPYPIVVEIPAYDRDMVRVTWRWTLTAYEAGDQPLRAGDASVEPPLAIEVAPRTLWGLDETGIEHAFPLSRAVQHARDDASCSELGTFLREHPDAYVAWARHAEFTTPEGHLVRWDFMLTNGTATYGRQVVLREPLGTYLLPGVRDPGPPAATGIDCSEPASPPFSSEPAYLLPSELPAELPTVASLWARWQRMAGPEYAGQAPNNWGFSLSRDVDGQGGAPGLYVVAGRIAFTREAGALYPMAGDYVDTWAQSTVASHDGWDRVDRLDELRQSSRPATASPPPVSRPSTTTDVPATAASPVLAAISLFEVPSGPVATGISLGALAGSLLYYLWPALKSGGVGLFSRVRTDRLLDHPARARLVQAVETHPGIHQHALVRLVGASAGATEHHLRKLVDGGLLLRHQGTGFVCYFAKGTDRRAMAAAPVLKSPVAQRILEAARTRPGVPPSVLARELGVSAPTISYHLRRLEQAGLVDTTSGVRSRPDGPVPA